MVKLITKNTSLVRKDPLWKGPEVDGISQSMLCRYRVCKERFRLAYVLGLQERRQFSVPTEYGNMWHLCEEHLAAKKPWAIPLKNHAKQLVRQWPASGEEIEHWYRVCVGQFSVYQNIYNLPGKPFYQEQLFSVKYPLPSGRYVRLRGKMDAVFVINRNYLYLQENKSKSQFSADKLSMELDSDLQTMMYLTALDLLHTGKEVSGVFYNVARRPLSDRTGKFNISQRKGRKTKKGVVGAETKDEYYARLKALIEENQDYFFFRTRLEISRKDLVKFQQQCLIPLLEDLCNWWEWISKDPFNPWRKGNKIHYRSPFGVYDPLLEGRQDLYCQYLRTGNRSGLEQINELFPELKEGA